MLTILFRKISLLVPATFLLLVATVISGQAASQPDPKMWQRVDESSLDRAAHRLIIPLIYRTVRVDNAALAQVLAAAPMEFTAAASNNPGIIYLPMPDGTMARFRFEESPIMEPGLAAKFPTFKTYRAQGIDDPAASARFDWLPTGFHAIVLAPSGTVLIDPYARGNTRDYITYWKRDAANLAGPFRCDFKDSGSPEPARGCYFRHHFANLSPGVVLHRRIRDGRREQYGSRRVGGRGPDHEPGQRRL